MARTFRTAPCGVTLLATMSLFFAHSAVAESDKKFAKCTEMLGTKAASHLKKAQRARDAHEKRVARLISKYSAEHSSPEQENTRMTAIIAKMIARYNIPDYQRVYIDEAAEEILAAKNGDNFRCPDRVKIRLNLRIYLENYEARLSEAEDEAVERIDLENVGPNEGLVVLLFYANGYAGDIHINRLGTLGGDIHFGPVDDRDYFRVIKAKVGDYQWHSIWNKNWRGRTVLFLKRRNLGFKVEAGKLNYTGVFLFSNADYKGWTAGLRDRTSVVLSLLEDRYPELLDRFRLNNGFESDNRFIDFYLSEKLAAQEVQDGA